MCDIAEFELYSPILKVFLTNEGPVAHIDQLTTIKSVIKQKVVNSNLCLIPEKVNRLHLLNG